MAQGFQADVLSLILHSGPMAQLVLVVLGFFSVLAWAIYAVVVALRAQPLEVAGGWLVAPAPESPGARSLEGTG